MRRRLVTIAIAVLGALTCLGGATGSSYAASNGQTFKTLPACLGASDANLDLPTCTQNSDGTFTVSFSSGSDAPGGPGSGGIPGAFIALLVVIVVVGVGTTIWRVSTARNMARQAGMDPGRATAVTLLGGEGGFDAAYLSASLRQPPTAPVPAAPAAPAAPATHRSAAERLTELQQLRDHGLVTAEEYDARHKAIVDAV